MSFGRVLSSLAAAAAVGGCAVVAIGMGNAATVADTTRSDPGRAVVPSRTARPAYLPVVPPAPATVAVAPSVPVPSSAPGTSRPAMSRPVIRPVAAPPLTSPAVAARPAGPTPAARPHRVVVARTPSAVPAPRPVSHSAPPPRPAPVRVAATGLALPLHFSTGTATRVITVVTPSYGSTTATLQAWDRVSGGGWRKVGTAMTAHIGADGMSSRASEYRSATPIGSFTLTQAFGHNSDPGTNLPYLHTNANDWWISQAGPLYNTHQRCAYSCGFTRGDPNEHLYYETPYYNYGVVIDYNTRNAPGGVQAGRGSAFFLHVTDGSATAGCVAVAQSRLIPLMRWLTPSAHPRILMGVA